MMRRYLAGDCEALLFCSTDHFNRAGGRYMSNMNARAGELCKHYVSRYMTLLCRAAHSFQTQQSRVTSFVHHSASRKVSVLSVVDDHESMVACVLHCVTHHLTIHHRAAVIGNRDCAGLFPLSHLRQLFAL